VGPPFGKVKGNVDAAFGDSKGGIGIVACSKMNNDIINGKSQPRGGMVSIE
jgi:hypothetical protein